VLSETDIIHADTPSLAGARLFAAQVREAFGIHLNLQRADGAATDIAAGRAGLATIPTVERATPVSSGVVRFTRVPDLEDAYALEIDDHGIAVVSRDEDGLFAAVATLRQLAGPQAFRRAPVTRGQVAYPQVTVNDSPRFEWRGVHLDVARHFMPKDGVLRFIDLAASHKLNVVHLHLTDDQGWRVEIKAFPELTRVGAWRAESGLGAWRHNRFDGQPHGGFYTQDDLREIVAFAKDRGITIMPEIDVPGHSQAAIAAYPHLGCATASDEPPVVRTTWGISTQVLNPNRDTVDFFKTVFDEVMDVFDTPYIGLGGDEVPPLLWREDPQIVAFASELGLESVDELHGWFLGQLGDFIVSKGRRPVVWDEGISPYLSTEAIVTTWRGYQSGAQALALGYDIVLAPEQNLYLDHRAADGEQEPVPVGFVRTLNDVLAFEPDKLPHLGTQPSTQSEFEAQGDRIVANQAHESGEEPPRTARESRLLGVQAQLWTEHLNTPRRVDYAAYPRLSAFAEVAWSPRVDRTAGTDAAIEFVERLSAHHLPRLDAAGVEYRPLDRACWGGRSTLSRCCVRPVSTWAVGMRAWN
jgi:hexosaminidase